MNRRAFLRSTFAAAVTVAAAPYAKLLPSAVTIAIPERKLMARITITGEMLRDSQYGAFNFEGFWRLELEQLIKDITHRENLWLLRSGSQPT